ncbi:MAG: hydrogenase nickel incorporation protein HypB [Synergistaceae bacterium]|jgi:hydrogenase nickel incorporation protein HypB|nr:hydrogenase nickel incorporation protein HypB [Synergistaceae bacterium]
METVITIRQAVMAEDEKCAFRVRETLKERKILGVNIIGSPGCGKTTLLEQTAAHIERESPFSFLVIEGDVETARDAQRLAAANVEALQINTKGACHLEAHVIENALQTLGFSSARYRRDLDVIFIENVGNLVCPAEFDLGEDFKVAVSSVPEGADKPLKYPMLFSQAAVVLLTKVDLLPYVKFDKALFARDVKALNPKAPIMELDLTSGAGLESWIAFIAKRLEEKRHVV